jgi:deoxyribodipyrimidine photo-lyase
MERLLLFLMDKSNNKLFLAKGLKDKKYKYLHKNEDYNNFFNAKSGVNIVDTSIKGNRNRQLVARYFIKNLGFNWLDIARFLETNLIDYDVSSNYGNCAYQGYVVNDSSYRVFDVIKQSKLYDGENYIKEWLNKKEETPNFNIDLQINIIKINVYGIF